jgi:hypothetical protein
VESTPVRITQAHQFYGRAMTNPSEPPPSVPQPNQSARRAGDWLLYVALGLFGIGLLAVVTIFLVGILSDSDPALWLYLTAMLAPLGFLLSVIFALRSGRRAR